MKMTTHYLLRQPECLEKLAIDQLAVWIRIQASKLMAPISALEHDVVHADAEISYHVDAIRECLACNMPKMYYDVLAAQTIAQLYELLADTGTETVGRLVETLFTEHLTSLTLTFDQFRLLRESFCSESHRLVGLTHLDLYAIKSDDARVCQTDVENDVVQFLEELHSLKYLSIIVACTDQILNCIVKNCTLIEELIFQTFRISEYNINLLTKLHNLRNITLKASVKGTAIRTLLLSCKNIELIDISSSYEYDKISLVLVQLASHPEHASNLFNLKTYTSTNNTLEELQIAFRMCPHIQTLTVHASSRSRQGNVMAVVGLQELRELTLEGFGFYSGHVQRALQVVGGQLEHLELWLVTQMDLNALIDISEMCPNLQSLTLEQCEFVDRNQPRTKKSEILPFRNLKKLSLDMKSSFYIQEQPLDLTLRTIQHLKVLHAPALFLLSNCLNVEYMEFTKTVMLTEDFMMCILNKNPLSNLRELKIVQSDGLPRTMTALTALVLERLSRGAHRPQVIQVPQKYEHRRRPQLPLAFYRIFANGYDDLL